MPKFQEHGIVELFADLIYPIVITIIIWKFPHLLPKIGKQTNLIDIIKIVLLLLFLPNNTYAFFEIKHLFFAKTPSDIYSYLVFGGIALVGLASAVYAIVTITSRYATNVEQVFLWLVVLCLINGFGAVLGLLNLYSWQAVTSPILFVAKLAELFSSPLHFALASNTSLFLFCLCFPFLLPA